MNCIDVLGILLDLHAEIEECLVFEPNQIPKAQDRIDAQATCLKAIEKGLHIRNELSLPFWDAVLISCLAQGPEVFPLLTQASFHNSPPRRCASIGRANWQDMLSSFCRGVLPGGIVALNSRVCVSTQETKHIPMLDFHCPSSESNQELATAIAKMLDPHGGFLLSSGNSYHFYGKSLIGENELNRFLGRALLLAPIIDRAWIGHQLIEGSCALRIFGGCEPSLMTEY